MGGRAAHKDRSRAAKATRRGRATLMTTTVTAIAATNRERQRPATAHNTRTIRANLGYVRPEKQTVEDQRRAAATVAKPLNSTRRTWTTPEYQPGLRSLTDGPGRLAHSHGSDAPVPAACPS